MLVEAGGWDHVWFLGAAIASRLDRCFNGQMTRTRCESRIAGLVGLAGIVRWLLTLDGGGFAERWSGLGIDLGFTNQNCERRGMPQITYQDNVLYLR